MSNSEITLALFPTSEVVLVIEQEPAMYYELNDNYDESPLTQDERDAAERAAADDAYWND